MNRVEVSVAYSVCANPHCNVCLAMQKVGLSRSDSLCSAAELQMETLCKITEIKSRKILLLSGEYTVYV